MQPSEEILFQVSREQILTSFGFSAYEAKVLMDAGALLPDGTIQITESVLQKIPFHIFFGKGHNLDFVVPDDYNHEKQIALSVKEAIKNEYVKKIGKDFTDKAFSKVSDKLLPGGKYQASFFWVKPKIQIDEKEEYHKVSNPFCVLLLKKHKALFTGAQGLTLMWNLKGEELVGYHTRLFSFGDKDVLNFVESSHSDCFYSEAILAEGDGDFQFYGGYYHHRYSFYGQGVQFLCITTAEEE